MALCKGHHHCQQLWRAWKSRAIFASTWWSNTTSSRLETKCYHQDAGSTATPDGIIVDMRSDTITLPTAAMRKAMAEAEVGDDVFGEDPTVNLLQKEMADLFNKEAALFVPTGTMGNLIAVLAHCQERGLEVIIGDKSHIYLYEQGGIAQLGGVHPRAIINLPDGTFNIDDLDSLMRPTNDVHQPLSKLVCVENTQNMMGGRVIPLKFLQELGTRASQLGLQVHMDGARLMNAAVALDVSPASVVEHVDSITMCFSKGLGAPVGSILAGAEQFIARGVRLRKVLGGGMRQAGVIAAAALTAMEDATERLQKNHDHARLIAQAIKDNGNGVVDVDIEGVDTNIVMIDILKDGLSAEQLCERLKQVTLQERQSLGTSVQVRVRPARMSRTRIRMYTHSGLTNEDVSFAADKWKYVCQEFDFA